MSITKSSVSKIFTFSTEPNTAVENRFWFDSTNKILKRYNGTSWEPINIDSDNVIAKYPTSQPTTLTEYLSTLVEAIGDKQDTTTAALNTTDKTIVGAINEVNTALNTKADSLLYYSETSGASPSATISVANINLRGSVAEGDGITASGDYSHAEGNSTTASGDYSHAEGSNTTASGDYSHAEGNSTTASNTGSHAEGFNTKASGQDSHAEGYNTTALGRSSHVEGQFTTASSPNQHVQGQYNIEDANSKYADIIGNGSSPSARSNAATVSWDGISWSKTDVRAGGTDQDNATHSLANKQDKLLYYSETSGDITISAADTSVQNEQGGTINISAGKNTQSLASGSSITLNGNTSNSVGGTAVFLGGNGTQSGGGKIIAEGGDGGTGGNINIQAGDGIGSKGNIILGDANNLYLNSSAIGGSLVDSTISSSSLNTHIPTSKAVYALLGAMQVQSTTQKSIVMNAAQTGVQIDSTNTKACRITVNPKITNTGAIYITNSSTYTGINPIYPDQLPDYTFPNLSQVYVFSDNVGDGVDLTIESYGY